MTTIKEKIPKNNNCEICEDHALIDAQLAFALMSDYY